MRWPMYPPIFSLQCLRGHALYIENMSQHLDAVTSTICMKLPNFENINFKRKMVWGKQAYLSFMLIHMACFEESIMFGCGMHISKYHNSIEAYTVYNNSYTVHLYLYVIIQCTVYNNLSMLW